MPDNSSARQIRRVITGHNPQGLSVFQEDAVSPFTLEMPDVPGLVVTDLWKSFETPADNNTADEPCSEKVTLAPPDKGSLLRMVQFPPDGGYMDKWDAHSTFAAMGHKLDAEAAHKGKTAGMHCTRSLDYAIVMSGEIWAVMDEGETLLKAGDVLIQRGTNHGWSNRTAQPALVAFVLIGAQPIAAGQAA